MLKNVKMSENNAEIVEKIKSLIYRTCLNQDDLKWGEWLDACDEEFEYAIRVYSPEVSADITYLSGNRAHMRSLVEMLPKHNSDHSPLKRHCTVYDVQVAEDGTSATATTSLAVYQTLLDGINSHVDAGSSRLFLVGRYHDCFSIREGGVKFAEREVRLLNRRLDKGSHYPI